jgi:hypothetical protein
MNLIIYLQSWSESMALAPFDFLDFSSFPQNLGFLVHPISEGIVEFGKKNLFWNMFLVLR